MTDLTSYLPQSAGSVYPALPATLFYFIRQGGGDGDPADHGGTAGRRDGGTAGRRDGGTAGRRDGGTAAVGQFSRQQNDAAVEQQIAYTTQDAVLASAWK